jgi:Ku70/Ku80 beta-barrel domain
MLASERVNNIGRDRSSAHLTHGWNRHRSKLLHHRPLAHHQPHSRIRPPGAIGSAHTIEIEQFVPRNEIDELYWNIPYYIAPEGEIGRQAFVVIREATEKQGMVALGRVVFTTREHVVAVERAAEACWASRSAIPTRFARKRIISVTGGLIHRSCGL